MRSIFAIFLSGCLLVSSSVLPVRAYPFFQPASASPAFIQPPPKIGLVAEHFKGASSRKVILIQDLHAHLGTQRKIAELLRFYDRNGYLQHPIAIEGAEGPWDLTYLDQFPVKDRKAELNDYLLNEAGLTGPEWFALDTRRPKLLYGVDKQSEFEVQRALFARSYALRQAVVQQLTLALDGITNVESSTYRGRLRLWEKATNDFEKGQLYPDLYLKKMASLGRRVGVYPREDSLQKVLRAKSAEDLAGISASDVFYSDVRHFAQQVGLRLAKSAEQGELLKAHYAVELLVRLFRNQVTLEEVKTLASKQQQLAHLASEVISASGQSTLISEDALLELVRISTDFYVTALVRDNPLAQNVLKVFDQNLVSTENLVRHENVVLLVVGGFHVPGITQALRQQDVSYDVITPNIAVEYTAKDEALYAARLAQVPVSFPGLIADPARSTVTSPQAKSASSLLWMKFKPMEAVRWAIGLRARGVGNDVSMYEHEPEFVNWQRLVASKAAEQTHAERFHQLGIVPGNIRTLQRDADGHFPIAPADRAYPLLDGIALYQGRLNGASIPYDRVDVIHHMRGPLTNEDLFKNYFGPDSDIEVMSNLLIIRESLKDKPGKYAVWIYQGADPLAALRGREVYNDQDVRANLAAALLFHEHTQGHRDPSVSGEEKVSHADLVSYGATFGEVLSAMKSRRTTPFLDRIAGDTEAIAQSHDSQGRTASGLTHEQESRLEAVRNKYRLGESDLRYLAALWLQRLFPNTAKLKIVRDPANPQGDENFILASDLSSQQRRDWLGAIPFAEIDKDPAYSSPQENVRLIVNSLDGGIGEAVGRLEWLKARVRKEGGHQSDIKMGAKGTDLGFDVELEGQRVFISIAEVKLLQIIDLARNGDYGQIVYEPLVNGQSLRSYEDLFRKPYLMDRVHRLPVSEQRTYRTLFQNLGIELPGFPMQADLPAFEEATGLITLRDNAPIQPGGHGQWGFTFLWEAFISRLSQNGKTVIRFFANGDNVNSRPNRKIVKYMVVNHVPIIKLTTAATPMDKKGGKDGIRILKKNGAIFYVPDQLEIADARSAKQEAEFYAAGLSGDPERAQPFNTNIIYLNLGLLHDILNDLVNERLISREEVERIISPTLIDKPSKAVEGHHTKYVPVDGAIGSAIHNLNAFFITHPEAQPILAKHGVKRLLEFVDVPRTQFFAPIKSTWDAWWLRLSGDFYRFNSKTWALEDVLPIQVQPEINLVSLGPDGKDDKWWNELQHVVDAFGDAKTRGLKSLHIEGKVILQDAQLTGNVKIVNHTGHIVNLRNPQYQTQLRSILKGQDHHLVIHNITITFEAVDRVSIQPIRTEPAAQSVRSVARRMAISGIAGLVVSALLWAFLPVFSIAGLVWSIPQVTKLSNFSAQSDASYEAGTISNAGTFDQKLHEILHGLGIAGDTRAERILELFAYPLIFWTVVVPLLLLAPIVRALGWLQGVIDEMRGRPSREIAAAADALKGYLRTGSVNLVDILGPGHEKSFSSGLLANVMSLFGAANDLNRQQAYVAARARINAAA